MDIYDDIKESMKQIVEETNNVLKYSSRAYKKIKEQTLLLDEINVEPSESVKEWFVERNICSITIPDFFDRIFKEASNENRLDFHSKTILFHEKDAKIFGFVAETNIHILDFFEKIPNYFI